MTGATPLSSAATSPTADQRGWWGAVRHRVDACWVWLEERPRTALVIVLTVAAAMRLPFLTIPLETDEGGFLMVAGQWHGPGDSLYTDQWVDRPPLLLLVFKLADWLGGSLVVLRLLSLVFGSIIVVAAGHAGRVINAARGAVMSAVVAGTLSASFALDGYALTGECIAGAFVMSSCALILRARFGRHSVRASVMFALGAGFLAALAFLTKQNFIDATVFAVFLVGLKLPQLWRLALAGAGGLLIPVTGTVLWAQSPDGPGVVPLLVAWFRFRQRSLNVIEDARLTAPLMRLQWLVVLAIVSGLVFLIIAALVAATSARHRRSLRIALIAMVSYVVLSILVGASWWRHYLLQLTAPMAIGAALSTRLRDSWSWCRLPASFAVVSAVVTTVVAMFLPPNTAYKEQTVARYLAAASHSDDTLMLAYGAPNVLQESGMSTPYRYSWSLPIRTRDPQLVRFVATLRGPDAPTWLVEIGDFDWWDLDNPPFEQVRADRYRRVARVCGHDVYLLKSVERRLPSAPAC